MIPVFQNYIWSSPLSTWLNYTNIGVDLKLLKNQNQILLCHLFSLVSSSLLFFLHFIVFGFSFITEGETFRLSIIPIDIAVKN